MMNSVDAKNEFLRFNKDMQKKLISVMAHNPLVDFNNAVSLTIQDLDTCFREANDNNLSDFEEKNIVRFFHNNMSYDFIKTDEMKLDNKLIFSKISNIWKEKTGSMCYVNQEVDDNKKDVFIKDNKLWITDQLIDSGKAYYVLKTYAEYLIKDEFGLGINNLLFLLINTFYMDEIKSFDNINKKIDLSLNVPKIIYYSDDETRYLMFNKAFNYFKTVLYTFISNFLDLTDLIDFMNGNDIKLNIDINIINKIKNDVNNDNIPDFPYYFY